MKSGWRSWLNSPIKEVGACGGLFVRLGDDTSHLIVHGRPLRIALTAKSAATPRPEPFQRDDASQELKLDLVNGSIEPSFVRFPLNVEQYAGAKVESLPRRIKGPPKLQALPGSMPQANGR